MITKEQLESIDFGEMNSGAFCSPGFQYEFNIKTQELWDINDGVGEPEFLCRVTKFDELVELLETLPK